VEVVQSLAEVNKISTVKETGVVQCKPLFHCRFIDAVQYINPSRCLRETSICSHDIMEVNIADIPSHAGSNHSRQSRNRFVDFQNNKLF
jgi:hypothetical protein